MKAWSSPKLLEMKRSQRKNCTSSSFSPLDWSVFLRPFNPSLSPSLMGCSWLPAGAPAQMCDLLSGSSLISNPCPQLYRIGLELSLSVCIHTMPSGIRAHCCLCFPLFRIRTLPQLAHLSHTISRREGQNHLAKLQKTQQEMTRASLEWNLWFSFFEDISPKDKLNLIWQEGNIIKTKQKEEGVGGEKKSLEKFGTKTSVWSKGRASPGKRKWEKRGLGILDVGKPPKVFRSPFIPSGSSKQKPPSHMHPRIAMNAANALVDDKIMSQCQKAGHP